MIPLSNADFLSVLAEPTRLRVLNCVAAAPLFVSDLVAILELPQPTVSRHLKILRDVDVVRVTPVPPYALYRLTIAQGPRGKLVRSILEVLRVDPAGRTEYAAAQARSRASVQTRVTEADADAG